MPFIGIGLSTIIAIFFAIHAVRSGQNSYWLFILFVFPFLGSIVYCLAVFIPSMRTSRAGYQIESTLRKAIDPHKALREAQNTYEISPTIDATIRLAKALVDNGKAKDALPYYQNALTGIYQYAPDILLQYAYALFVCEDYLKARDTLDTLRTHNPSFRSDEGHLLYARILVALNDKTGANEEFSALIDYYPSLEALSQYLSALVQWREFDKARIRLNEYQMRIKHMPRHAKKLNAQWIKEIEQLKQHIR